MSHVTCVGGLQPFITNKSSLILVVITDFKRAVSKHAEEDQISHEYDVSGYLMTKQTTDIVSTFISALQKYETIMEDNYGGP